MNLNIDPKGHTHILAGDGTAIEEQLIPKIESVFELRVQGNPDVFRTHQETFGIDDARRVSDFASKRAVGRTQVFILSFDTITVEAQNALLKTLEEPTPHTHFFIVVPSTEILLPTVLSRGQVFELHTDTASGSHELASEVLAAHPGERLALVRDIIDAKDKIRTLKLLDGIETVLYTGARKRKQATFFNEIMMARGYIRGRSPSVKLVLEHLMLTLPTLK